MIVLLTVCLRARHPVARACRLAVVVATLAAAPRPGCPRDTPRIVARQATTPTMVEARIAAVRAPAPSRAAWWLDPGGWGAALRPRLSSGVAPG